MAKLPFFKFFRSLGILDHEQDDESVNRFSAVHYTSHTHGSAVGPLDYERVNEFGQPISLTSCHHYIQSPAAVIILDEFHPAVVQLLLPAYSAHVDGD